MPFSCPPEIRQLMYTPVTWEKFLGFDGHAEPLYAPGVELLCYREAHGLLSGGENVFRDPDHTTSDPQWDLFFSGDDPSAREFSLYDRFTPGGQGSSSAITEQVEIINTGVGPPFDNRNPWLIIVSI